MLCRTDRIRDAACGGALEADLRDASCGPPPGGGCGPLRPFGRNSEFNIQNSELHSGCSLRSARRFGNEPKLGAQLAKERTSGRKGGREQRAFAGRSCGPLGPDGPILTRNKPAAKRTGLFSSDARMQPSARGAVAGCRSLCDRACRQASSLQPGGGRLLRPFGRKF